MVAIKIRWTPAAEADLLDILEFYYKRNGTNEYSLKYYFDHYDLGLQTKP